MNECRCRVTVNVIRDAYTVQHCRLHAAAAEMHALLRETICPVCLRPSRTASCETPWHNEARALLRRIEEESTT